MSSDASMLLADSGIELAVERYEITAIDQG
jgi:hypothetical protein